jgi:hypothetical protein
MEIENDKPMPLTKKQEAYALANAKHETRHERFVCMDGPLAGRGLIVPMPANRVAGYNLYQSATGEHVAYHADLLS